MANLGKALSAYKKINNMRNKARKIQEARINIEADKAKAQQENMEVALDRDFINNITRAVSEGTGYGLRAADVVDSETAQGITAGLSTAGNLYNMLSSDTVKNNRALGAQESMETYDRNKVALPSNVADSFSRVKMLTDNITGREIEEGREDFEGRQGLTPENLQQFLSDDEIDFERGQGRRIGQEEILKALRNKANYLENANVIEDSDRWYNKRTGGNLLEMAEESYNPITDNKYT